MLKQTVRYFEVIVVDDDSTDETPGILVGYGEWIRVLMKPNERQPAPNLGLRAARGEYIAFLDADDCWAPTRLEKQVAVLDRCPSVGLVYTADAMIDSEGRVSETSPCPPDGRGRIYERLTVRNMMVGSSAMVRRTAIEEAGGYDESLASVENWDLWIRIVRRWEVEYVTSRSPCAGCARAIGAPTCSCGARTCSGCWPSGTTHGTVAPTLGAGAARPTSMPTSTSWERPTSPACPRAAALEAYHSSE